MNTTMLALFTRVQSRLVHDDDGASLVEYGLLLAFIFVVAVVAVTYVGREVSSNYNDVGQGFP